jgi:plastocyanin
VTERAVEPGTQPTVTTFRPSTLRPSDRAWLVVAAMVVLGGVLVAAALATRPGWPARLTVATAGGTALAFEPSEVVVEAGRAVEIVFQNRSTLQHNLTFTGQLEGATRTIVDPGMGEVVVVRPPGPGVYPFVCTVHPGMAGQLVVRDASAP